MDCDCRLGYGLSTTAVADARRTAGSWCTTVEARDDARVGMPVEAPERPLLVRLGGRSMISITWLGTLIRRGCCNEAARVGVRYDGRVFATALDVADTLRAEPLVSCLTWPSWPKVRALEAPVLDVLVRLSASRLPCDLALQPSRFTCPLGVEAFDGTELQGAQLDAVAAAGVVVDGEIFTRG